MTGPPTRVVVAGRDVALWLTAAVLQAALGASGVKVVAVELPTQLTASDVYAAQPALEALHARLGADEAQMLRLTQGSFTLGQNFTDLDGGAPAFFLAHGGYGAPVRGQDFFPFWLKARELGLEAPLEAFSLTAAAAGQGRMLLPDEITAAFGRTDYGYHLPALAYAGWLKSRAARLGVELHQAASLRPERRAETGEVVRLRLDDGRTFAGDLFVDATGREALLSDAPVESWRDAFPADRILVAQAPRFAAVPAYGEVRATANGWTGLFPNQARTHVVHVWRANDEGEDQALATASRAARTELAEPVVRRREPGRRSEPWTGACVAVGEAAAVFDPVHGVDLQALQLSLVQLLALFPVSAAFAPERAEYNRAMAESFARLRDFQAAHYHLNRYGDGAFWTAARAPAPAPELAHKIATFAARGEVALLEHETFLLDSWRALLTGHGLRPASYLPSVDLAATPELKAEVRRQLAFVKDQVLRQPPHDRYLGSYCRPKALGGAHG